MKYIVKEEQELMSFLLHHFARKQVKLYFKYKQVFVNKVNTSQFNYIVSVGDVVEIKKESNTNHSLDILFEDEDCIVINKPSGLLSVAGGGEKEHTAFHMVSQYVKQKESGAKVFVVHRLDKDTSGILLFAKSESFQQALQEDWNSIVTKRGYIAVVEGTLKQKEGTIKNYLDESKTQQVYICKEGGKLAITNYKVIKESKHYSLLEVFLKTGRKNQIRVHMQSIHHSIVADKKYGATSNPIKRLGLHCHIFAYTHPITHRVIEFQSPIPDSFHRLFM